MSRRACETWSEVMVGESSALVSFVPPSLTTTFLGEGSSAGVALDFLADFFDEEADLDWLLPFEDLALALAASAAAPSAGACAAAGLGPEGEEVD